MTSLTTWIYINRASTYTALDLYTTLAHEGYPGHLYQTILSGSTTLGSVRNLLNFGGYIEGWATYVEMYAYGLSDTDPNLAELYRLNRSLTLASPLSWISPSITMASPRAMCRSLK